MKIRILDPGFANFTGLFGSVDFVDGLSEEVSGAEAARLASFLHVETEEGKNPSITQHMVDTRNQNLADLGQAPEPVVPAPVEVTKPVSGEKSEVVVDKSKLSYDFTEEQIDELVKTQGIAGLRAFSDQYGVNGRSIANIVKELFDLKTLHNPVKQVEPVVEAPAPEAPEVAEAPVVIEPVVIEAPEGVDAAAVAAAADAALEKELADLEGKE